MNIDDTNPKPLDRHHPLAESYLRAGLGQLVTDDGLRCARTDCDALVCEHPSGGLPVCTAGHDAQEGFVGRASRSVAERGRTQRQSRAEGSFPRTDLGNAERFAHQHRDRFRFVVERRSWIVWDGRRWAIDATGEIHRAAKRTVRSMMIEAAGVDDQKEHEALVKWALSSESAPRIKAMLNLAQWAEGIPIHTAELDANPYALNCQNGILDLRTSVLRPHNPDELHSRITAAPFDPDAQCEILPGFLLRILPDEELRRFVQRAAGYSLLGVPEAEALFFAYGPAASGKSTLLEGMRTALGDYAMTAESETWMQRSSGGPRQDIARLAGARLVLSVEIEQGARLASGLIKSITGGDTITARHLYGQEFEFRPAFALWLAANDEPRVRDDDEGMWRRVHQLPFTESIPEKERDPAVKATITDVKGSGAALMAWMVEGLAEYLKIGLSPPDSVRAATRAYRDRMDPIADWWNECIVEDPAGSVTAEQLFRSYSDWATREGVRQPIKPRSLGMRISRRGFQSDGRENTRCGIALVGQ